MYSYLGMLDMGGVKAIYIAPMKALAQEVVTKFQERLKGLRMTVKVTIGHLFLIIIDVFLYLCLSGWSLWKYMVCFSNTVVCNLYK
jgi:hypothetical protein